MKKLIVLVADDDADMRGMMEEFLLCWGYTVILAADTDEALAVLNREEVDIVWSDEQMPGGGGAAVLEASKRLKPDRPVIVCSGTADESEFMERGATAVIRKPALQSQFRPILDGIAAAVRAENSEIVTLGDIHELQERASEHLEGSNAVFIAYASLMREMNTTLCDELPYLPEEIPLLPRTTPIGPRARAMFQSIVDFLDRYCRDATKPVMK